MVMKTETIRDAPAYTALSRIDGVLSLSELCAQLQVSAQTIYDLRSQGRGPRGFRVGRELRFRVGGHEDVRKVACSSPAGPVIRHGLMGYQSTASISWRSAATCSRRAFRPALVSPIQVVRRPARTPLRLRT